MMIFEEDIAFEIALMDAIPLLKNVHETLLQNRSSL